MSRWGRVVVLVSALLVCASRPARADFPDGFNHPEVPWYELETDHFLVVFTPTLETTARLAADILEQVHEPTCAALGTRPGAKTTVILADFDDVGFNNFARRMQHVIYISNPVMNQARVDREQWLRHLLAHEYVHVVNGWAIRDYGRALGEILEWAGMETQPQWFTEGLAEYVSGDAAKTESQFVLQAAQQRQLLWGGKLDIADLRFDVIETSVVYKQGHSMCMFLAEKYGEDIFRRLLKQYARTPEFDVAFKVATGDTVEHFYHLWLSRTLQRAAQRPAPAADPVLTGTEELKTPLVAALGARMSPDGRTVAVYGVDDWEEPIPKLYVMNADGSGCHQVANNLDLYDSWKLSWSADSRYLLFAGRVRNNAGSIWNAIFIHDRTKNKTWKVNTGATRCLEPDISPDGKRIAFTSYQHERALIATMATDGSDVRYVTRNLAEDCFSPSWSPDGSRLAFSVTDASGTDLATIAADGTDFRRLTHDAWPDQYPAWSPDGRTIAFVSYRQAGGDREDAAVSAEAQGLSVASTNLYTIPATGGAITQLTRTTSGGAYYPTWTPDGRSLLFSLFQVRVATIRRLQLGAAATGGTQAAAPPTDAFRTEPVRLASAKPTLTASGEVDWDDTVTVGRLPVRSGPPAPKPTREGAAVPAPPAAASAAPAPAPIAAQAVATATASPAATTTAPERPSARATLRPYGGFSRVVPFVYRPYQDTDGLGDVFGARVRFADPLLKHQFSAQVDYGTGKSDKWGFEAQYLNAQTDFTVGATFFRRVPPLRAERNALIAETSTGFELLAELPVPTGNNAYTRDKVQFGYEYANHAPFATSGGVLRPAPRNAVIAGPSVGYSRVQLLPGIGEQEVRVKVTRADKAFGSDLGFFSTNLLYLGRFFAPDPRKKANVGLSLSHFTGADFTRAQAHQMVLVGAASWDWRFADETLSRMTWPYLHIGPSTLSVGYELRELLSGNSAGLDLRDRFTIQLRNRGYLTRLATYDLTVGPTFYNGGHSKPDWLVALGFHWRDLPY